MRAVVQTDEGTEFNWTWMPSWIGMNRHLQEKMQEELGPIIVGRTLDEAHEMVLSWIGKKFPTITGLREYLAGISHVEILDGKD